MSTSPEQIRRWLDSIPIGSTVGVPESMGLDKSATVHRISSRYYQVFLSNTHISSEAHFMAKELYGIAKNNAND